MKNNFLTSSTTSNLLLDTIPVVNDMESFVNRHKTRKLKKQTTYYRFVQNM